MTKENSWSLGFDPGMAGLAAFSLAKQVARRHPLARLLTLANALARSRAMRGPIPTHTPGGSTEELNPGWGVMGRHCNVDEVWFGYGEWTPGDWTCHEPTNFCSAPPGFPITHSFDPAQSIITGFEAGEPVFLGVCIFRPGTVYQRSSGTEPFGFTRSPGVNVPFRWPSHIDTFPDEFPEDETEREVAPGEPPREPPRRPPLDPWEPPPREPPNWDRPKERPWEENPWDDWVPLPARPAPPFSPRPYFPPTWPSRPPLTPPEYTPGEDMPQEWPEQAPVPNAPPKPWAPVPVPYPAAPGLPSFSPEGEPVRGPLPGPGPGPSPGPAPGPNPKPWERPNDRVVLSPDGRWRSRAPHVNMPPGPREREIKLHFRTQVPIVRKLGELTEYCDAVDGMWDALPNEVKAKYDSTVFLRRINPRLFTENEGVPSLLSEAAKGNWAHYKTGRKKRFDGAEWHKARKSFNDRNAAEPNPLFRSKWGRKATCQVKAKAVYDNLDKLANQEAMGEVLKNWILNEIQDRTYGKAGQGAASLSKQTNQPFGWGSRF